ncbi:TPA: phage tail domain-containing protein [Enterococcus faecium]
MHDETQVYLMFDNEIVHFNKFFNANLRIASVGPRSPEPLYEFEEFSGSSGKRLINMNYTGFPFVLNFRLSAKSLYDYQLVLSEMRRLFYRDEPYYIVYSREPGKRFKVLPQPWDERKIMPQKGKFNFVFDVFEARSESINSTLSDFVLDKDWQFSQGLISDDFSYSQNVSRFTIFNAGDFTVDPREHHLRISIKGESDGHLLIFNRTTGERFIYYKALSSRLGEILMLDGVYPRKNGVNCGIDTNHGVITLLPGENEIEIQNICRVTTEWDFHFLYR